MRNTRKFIGINPCFIGLCSSDIFPIELYGNITIFLCFTTYHNSISGNCRTSFRNRNRDRLICCYGLGYSSIFYRNSDGTSDVFGSLSNGEFLFSYPFKSYSFAKCFYPIIIFFKLNCLSLSRKRSTKISI